MPAHALPGRERAFSIVQYLLLGGLAVVAAGISAQGLMAFGRSSMGLRGPWPFLLFCALDGAAAVCAVLLTRRASRGSSAFGPRLAVWGLVSASAAFNWTHAPRHPAAAEAFAVMPVITAVLFEFCLWEQAQRSGNADRQMGGLRWLHPVERVRVQARMADDRERSAASVTTQIRVECAARRVYQLHRALSPGEEPATPASAAGWRARRAEQRAQRALIRAGYTDPAIASEILREVKVYVTTRNLAMLDYERTGAIEAAVAELNDLPAGASASQQAAPRTVPGDAGAAPRPAADPRHDSGHEAWPGPGRRENGSRNTGPDRRARDAHRGDGEYDTRLLAAASRIADAAGRQGTPLTRKALAEQLREQGFTIGNRKLQWLGDACGLDRLPSGRRARPAAETAGT